MKNKIIKLVEIFALTLVIALSYMTVAEAKTLVSGKCGENLTWTYNKKTKELSITGKGDMYQYKADAPKYEKYMGDIKKIKIGKNVSFVSEWAFYLINEQNNIYAEIHCDTNNFEYGSLSGVSKIKLYGNAEGLAKALGTGTYNVTKITKAKGNNKVKIKDNMVTSKNGRHLYLYYGKNKTFIIPDNIVSIGEYAFMGAINLKSVTLGQNVKTIGKGAFYYDWKLKKLKCNGRLKKIGAHAFDYTKLEKIVSLPKGVSIGQQAFETTKLETVTLGNNTKVGIMAFSTKTTIRARKNFKKICTSVGKAYFMKYDEGENKGNSMELKWSKVEGADGYEIVLQQGDYVKRWTQKKSFWSTSTVGDTPIEQFNLEDSIVGNYWFMTVDSMRDEQYAQENPIYVKVRAYRTTKKGKIIYTKWSNSEQILECDVPD